MLVNKKKEDTTLIVISSSDIIPVCFNRFLNEWNM